VTFPNGPSCGECKHGTITVVIDGHPTFGGSGLCRP
jgi:hypothetical protein